MDINLLMSELTKIRKEQAEDDRKYATLFDGGNFVSAQNFLKHQVQRSTAVAKGWNGRQRHPKRNTSRVNRKQFRPSGRYQWKSGSL